MAGELGKNLIVAVAIAAVLVTLFNVGFSMLFEEPTYPDCYPKVDTAGTVDEIDCSAAYQTYDDARTGFNRALFVYSLILGLGALAVGLMANLRAISWGIAAGGAIQLIWGGVAYWTYMGKFIRFGTLTLVLVALIWLANWKLNKK